MRCGNVLMWHLLILVTCSGKSGFHSMKFHRRCTDAVPASGLRLFFLYVCGLIIKLLSSEKNA